MRLTRWRCTRPLTSLAEFSEITRFFSSHHSFFITRSTRFFSLFFSSLDFFIFFLTRFNFIITLILSSPIGQSAILSFFNQNHVHSQVHVISQTRKFLCAKYSVKCSSYVWPRVGVQLVIAKLVIPQFAIAQFVIAQHVIVQLVICGMTLCAMTMCALLMRASTSLPLHYMICIF